MKRTTFALIDCNNFFVSCERVFNPKIWNKPVMVLSNNDGCVVARSNEVKAIGIKMGTPAFKCKDLIKKYNIQVFSSNYTLYADMSNRVMECLKQFASDIEIYSIDEAFLSLDNIYIKDFQKYGLLIKNKIYKWTGIPVSVGIAYTKGLAKIALKIVKKDPQYKGVLDFTKFNREEADNLLQEIDVIDIWGIGPAHSKKLKTYGINTVKDFKYANTNWIKKNLTVMGERCALELNGIPCFELEEFPAPQKGICSSRSFGYPVVKKDDMEEAVASYTAIASEKLRSQKSYANIIIVFIKTNRFKKEPQYANAAYVKMIEPTSSTIDLTKYALIGLEKVFKKGYRYKKCGVILEGIQPSDRIQLNMFNFYNHKQKQKENKLMLYIDSINKQWGRGIIKLASEGTKKTWSMKRYRLSKRFTTEISEILEIEV